MNNEIGNSIKWDAPRYFGDATKLKFMDNVWPHFVEIIAKYLNEYSFPLSKDKRDVDVPYKYNERATLSLFAGAIWKAHPENIVMEEYSVDKKGKKGRRDIWFRIFDPKEGFFEYRGEAKQRSKLYDVKKHCEDHLDLLFLEGKEITGVFKSNSACLGILFKIIAFTRGDANYEEKLRNSTEWMADKIQKSDKAVCWARYYNPELKKVYDNYHGNDKPKTAYKWFYPGFDLFLYHHKLINNNT